MVGGSAFLRPQPQGFPSPFSSANHNPSHIIATAAALHLGHFLHHRLIGHRHLHHHLGLFLHSTFKRFSHFCEPRLKDQWHGRTPQFKDFNILQRSCDALETCSSYLYSLSGEGNGNESTRKSYSGTSGRVPYSRKWTNILLAINVLVYIAQLATQGKLLIWGAKVNSLIDKGQIWRLVTSSVLHANVGHLMVNCYSLNSIGPTTETISGPGRFLAVYTISAIASSSMSYWLCKAPAVGASGAIFGLVGSFAVFVLRHRDVVKGSNQDLQHIVNVIALNMVIGLMSKGIDNWGHLGGLIGGAAASWLLGPAWRYEPLSNDGRRAFADRAPIFSIIKRRKPPSTPFTHGNS